MSSPLVRLRHAHFSEMINIPGGVDLSPETCQGLGKLIVPLQKDLDEYLAQLEKTSVSIYERLYKFGLWNGGVLTFYCQCDDSKYCPVPVLEKFLLAKFPDKFSE